MCYYAESVLGHFKWGHSGFVFGNSWVNVSSGVIGNKLLPNKHFRLEILSLKIKAER